MKKLSLCITLFTILLPAPGHAEWTKVDENSVGTIYVDFGRIRKVDGYVYYWYLGDYLKPSESGTLSTKVYTQGDCELFRFMGLTVHAYKAPMGRGDHFFSYTPDKEWTNPVPESVWESVLKKICRR